MILLMGARLYRARVERRNAMALAEERRQIAEQASEAKSRFLADLGHEIRTPMTGVLGMAELLYSEPLNVSQRRRVEAIRAAGQHLMGLLNDALDLARIEAGRLELQDAPFDLHQMLSAAGELIRPQAESKGLEFELVLEESLPRGVLGDAGRLRQIVLNLGHNAAKFTNQGKVILRAGKYEGRIRIDVIDTGAGIDAASQEHLFGRFTQAEGARTWSIHGGSGLGLSICRQLTRAMQGNISVVSETGCGACFTVTIPLPEIELLERRSTSRLKVRDVGAEAKMILLVEDDALVAEVISELLTKQGHTVTSALHGLEALTRVSNESFDLAFLDLDLPGLDGLELARIWPQQELAAPIVALTARADSEAEPQARSAGMVGFLRKPVTGMMLADAVSRFAKARVSNADDASCIEHLPMG
jgi:CheY-like chemotaxis protein/nitrogen-specific signal transduction histidine kinase